MSEGIECSYDEPVYCPHCQEHIGYACVNCGDIYDGGAMLNYGECSCIRKANAPFVGIDVASGEDKTVATVCLQETFQDAVKNDPDMTDEQKEYWLSKNHLLVQESFTMCPDGHGYLVEDGGLLFCPFCKYTTSKEKNDDDQN